MKTLKQTINGLPVEGYVQKIGNKLWVHVDGRTFIYEAPTSSRRSGGKSHGKASSDTIVAPMPGKVTKILVQPRSPISAGQAVVVMEAMKMEYTLKADVATQVLEVNCNVGDQVALGQVLVKFRSAENQK